jgi:hypothetical protein
MMFTIDDLRPHEDDVLRIKGLDFRLCIEEDDEGVPHAVWKTWKVPLQVLATPNSHEGMLLVAELSWADTQDLMGTAVYRGDPDDLNTYSEYKIIVKVLITMIKDSLKREMTLVPLVYSDVDWNLP